MPQVYIDSLTIKDFGPFYGDQILKLGNLDGRCGILVGGKNGAGKTHLLRALYLAVVGVSGVGDLKRAEAGADATRFVFEKSPDRRAHAEGRDTARLKVDLAVRDDKTGAGRKLRRHLSGMPSCTASVESSEACRARSRSP